MKHLWKTAVAVAAVGFVTVIGIRIAADRASNVTPEGEASPGSESMIITNFRVRFQAGAAKVVGLDPAGRFAVSFGPEPDYFLTLYPPDGDKPRTIVQMAVMASTPIPGTGQILFTALGDGKAPHPVYIVREDGADLKQIGTTETPWRIQATEYGLAAFREESTLVLFDARAGTRRAITGVTLHGTYPDDDTLWSVAPAGNRLALGDGQALTLIDLESGATRSITATLDRRRQTPGTWSPDGTLFAYGTESRSDQERATVWVAGPIRAEHKVYERAAKERGIFPDFAWVDGESFITYFRPAGPLGLVIPSTEYYLVQVGQDAKFLFKNGEGIALSADRGSLFVERQATANSITTFEIWQADLTLPD